jgi:hypothetical protein
MATPTTAPGIVLLAREELGVVEITRNRAPRIAKYWQATDYPEGEAEREPWCAAFVAWLVLMVLGPYAKRPRSAAVRLWVPAALRLGWTVFGPRDGLYFPRAGDIVVFTFSHIGIVEGVEAGTVRTIEGNTDDAGGREGTKVCRRRRALSACKSFIRLPEEAKP